MYTAAKPAKVYPLQHAKMARSCQNKVHEKSSNLIDYPKTLKQSGRIGKQKMLEKLKLGAF